jgi:hypothetical protein
LGTRTALSRFANRSPISAITRSFGSSLCLILKLALAWVIGLLTR